MEIAALIAVILGLMVLTLRGVAEGSHKLCQTNCGQPPADFGGSRAEFLPLKVLNAAGVAHYLCTGSMFRRLFCRFKLPGRSWALYFLPTIPIPVL